MHNHVQCSLIRRLLWRLNMKGGGNLGASINSGGMAPRSPRRNATGRSPVTFSGVWDSLSLMVVMVPWTSTSTAALLSMAPCRTCSNWVPPGCRRLHARTNFIQVHAPSISRLTCSTALAAIVCDARCTVIVSLSRTHTCMCLAPHDL